jgi:hypothetical protein
VGEFVGRYFEDKRHTKGWSQICLGRKEPSMVISELREQDLALAIVASVVGIAASWLTTTPFGLLAPGAAFFLFVRGRAAHVFYAALGVAFAGSMLTASLFADGMRDLALLWAAFFALALCIATIVAAGIPARTPSRIGKLVSDAIDAPLTPIPATACGSSGEADSQEARVLKIVESMRGHAWSADAAGNFTYVRRSRRCVVVMYAMSNGGSWRSCTTS